MPHSIPDFKIDEIRQATDILELVSAYVDLKKRGHNYFGLCPFHAEKTPSFSVNPDKQIFHCFGCGVGGNAFTFLMRHEGIGFPEAVKVLARRAGIKLEFEEIDEAERQETETLYYVNEFAARFFQEMLLSEKGRKALDYLKQRGFQLEDIKTFGLGYAPPGWDELISRAKKDSVEIQQLLKAGLVVKKDQGGYYDRFRDRVMFTIWNLSGRVVAFGGRKLDDAGDAPKYVNSPETTVYQKGKQLYGLYQNRDDIRKQDRAIFVEGYTDLMSLVSAGIRNVVATLGTALTEHQARLIRRYTRNVVLMYDSDTAGSAATLRGADILIENGLEVFVAHLPEGHDPDSFIKQRGDTATASFLQSAENLFDFKLRLALTTAPENRGEAIRSILASIAKQKDRIQRSLLMQRVSEKLEIDERILWAELDYALRQARRRGARRPTIGERLNELSQLGKASKAETAAEDLVKILLHDWSLAEFVFEQIELEELSAVSVYPILKYLSRNFKAGVQPSESQLISQFNDVKLSSVVANALSQDWSDTDFKRWAGDCINAIKSEALEEKMRQTREQIRQAQERREPVKDLLQTLIQLESQKKAILEKAAPLIK